MTRGRTRTPWRSENGGKKRRGGDGEGENRKGGWWMVDDKGRDLTAELHIAPPLTGQDLHPGSRPDPGDTHLFFNYVIHRWSHHGLPRTRDVPSLIHFVLMNRAKPWISVCALCGPALLMVTQNPGFAAILVVFQLPCTPRDQVYDQRFNNHFNQCHKFSSPEIWGANRSRVRPHCLDNTRI